MADAQTSGGLLLAVPPADAAAVVSALRDGGDPSSTVVGELVDEGRPGVVGIGKHTR